MKIHINSRISCVGIDGCNGKWVAVYITENYFEVGNYKQNKKTMNYLKNG